MIFWKLYPPAAGTSLVWPGAAARDLSCRVGGRPRRLAPASDTAKLVGWRITVGSGWVGVVTSLRGGGAVSRGGGATGDNGGGPGLLLTLGPAISLKLLFLGSLTGCGLSCFGGARIGGGCVGAGTGFTGAGGAGAGG